MKCLLDSKIRPIYIASRLLSSVAFSFKSKYALSKNLILLKNLLKTFLPMAHTQMYPSTTSICIYVFESAAKQLRQTFSVFSQIFFLIFKSRKQYTSIFLLKVNSTIAIVYQTKKILIYNVIKVTFIVFYLLFNNLFS